MRANIIYLKVSSISNGALTRIRGTHIVIFKVNRVLIEEDQPLTLPKKDTEIITNNRHPSTKDTTTRIRIKMKIVKLEKDLIIQDLEAEAKIIFLERITLLKKTAEVKKGRELILLPDRITLERPINNIHKRIVIAIVLSLIIQIEINIQKAINSSNNIIKLN
jgi:hypothetical protein